VQTKDTLQHPYRGRFGAPRPARLSALTLPPERMPSHRSGRPLKAWRYVGVYGPELMLCMAAVRIGPARQTFWAIWDRDAHSLRERTVTGRRGPVALSAGAASVRDRDVHVELTLEEDAGVETVCRSGRHYAWTRKQGGVRAHGTVWIHGRSRKLHAHGVIDDTAAYYARHTSWRWCAGVGVADDGRALAWNLVSGVNDPSSGSERTIWIDGRPAEVGPCAFAPDLLAVDALRFRPEAERRHRQNLLLVRSSYRQPFGTFSGVLPGGTRVAEGYGVMEAHDVWW
jgi:hypothetical protein